MLGLNDAHLKNCSLKFKIHLFWAKLPMISFYLSTFSSFCISDMVNSRCFTLSRSTSGCNNCLSFAAGTMLSWEGNIPLPALYCVFPLSAFGRQWHLCILIQSDRKIMPEKGISGEIGPCLRSLCSHKAVSRNI